MEQYFIGLMSGTSIDSLDAALIAVTERGTVLKQKLIGKKSRSWDPKVQKTLHALCSDGPHEIESLGRARREIASTAAALISELLKSLDLKASEITAIGSHGQTIRHRPHLGFTLQLDDPALLSALTGIDVVADFRSADVARGGEGAPLTPIFHREVFADNGFTFVLNIGGICNLTLIGPEKKLLAGFDTGPGNTLIDLTCRTLFNLPYDKDAALASHGKVQEELINKLLKHPYFALSAPKSTGRETFNEDYISPYLKAAQEGALKGEDLICTLTSLTCEATALEILKLCKVYGISNSRLILAGGGAFNPRLVSLFRERLATALVTVLTSSALGVDEQYLEAQAFAYFAALFVHKKPLSLTEITGSQSPLIMGALYPAANGAFVRGTY